MITIETVHTVELNDTELVAESRQGNREAFRRIVERYQALIASLAYCATGNVSQSEDLAQETFLRAWEQLGELREPARLRSWLCRIARFLISKHLRRQGREPVHQAESLEAVDEWASPEPLPPEHVISEEEKALMWRSLERIPQVYREPLVLFYREHQSIEAVARELELSEDAVKQRLSRGRKLLQEQFLAFVAGALQQTRPGPAFTVGVMAALPLLATSATAATVGTAAGKGGPAAKAATTGGIVSAFLSGGGLILLSLFGVFGFAGRWLGRTMGLASRQSARGRQRTIQFWRTLALGFLGLVLPGLLVPKSVIQAHPGLFAALTWMLGAFYWLLAAALGIWAWQRWRDARRPTTEPRDPAPKSDRSYNLWVTLGLLGPAYILAGFLYALFFSDWTLSFKSIPQAEARSIIAERTDARFAVHQYRDGSRTLVISLPEHRRIDLATPVHESLLAALAEKGIAYRTLVEDRDFRNGGVRGWLVLLCTFIVVAGTVLLVRRPGTRAFAQQEPLSPRARRRVRSCLAIGAALALLTLSVFLMLFTLAHPRHVVSRAEAQRLITARPDANFEVFHYRDGVKELWITPPGTRHYPGFVAPADASTLALLAERNINYPTRVQGRDFGYRGPSRWVAVSCSLAFAAAAVALLWWMVQKNRARPA